LVDHVATARRYLAAIESGAPFEEVAVFLTEDIVQEEFPNRITPTTARRDLAAMREASVKGRKVMTAQRFEILNAVVDGDTVVLEVQWSGTLAIPFGSIPAGGEMRARFAVFLEFRDGRIAWQRNYDCFEPW
jgi:ketosteroid isomerase-like protein